jgi:hypothetical protein
MTIINFRHMFGIYGFFISACLFLIGSTTVWWWTILLWPIPLWYQSWSAPLSFGKAVSWHMIATSGHFVGVCVGLYRLADGFWYLRLLVPVLVFGYYLLISVAWLQITRKCISYIDTHLRIRCFLYVWVVGTWLYFIFVSDYSLCICGVNEGYALFFPLIPLVDCPLLLWPMYFLGERLFLLVFLSVQALCVSCIISNRDLKKLLFVMVLWIGIANILSYWPHEMKPVFVQQLSMIKSQFFERDHVRAICHIMSHVEDSCRQNPAAACILFPESSIYAENAFPERGACTYQKDWSYTGNMVIGGFRRCGTRLHNTIWFISAAQVIDYFDKQHVVPITEYIPWWAGWLDIGRQFFAHISEISPSLDKQRPLWEITTGLHVVPYICSELFLAHRPRDAYGTLPILALCNNAWAPKMTRWIMARAIALRAVSWQRTIIYIAHDYASVMTKDGMQYYLLEESHVCGR